MTAAFSMVTGENCCVLLVDHQPGLVLNALDISPLDLKNNAVALAKVLTLLRIPTVITCAAGAAVDRWGHSYLRSLRASRMCSRSIAPRITPGTTRA